MYGIQNIRKDLRNFRATLSSIKRGGKDSYDIVALREELNHIEKHLQDDMGQYEERLSKLNYRDSLFFRLRIRHISNRLSELTEYQYEIQQAKATLQRKY